MSPQDSESGGFPQQDPWLASADPGMGSGGFESGSDLPAPPPTTNFDDEPPLLEELGINFEHIWMKLLGVLNPRKDISELADDADLAGPLVFCLILGFCLLLQGKLHFGYIYGFGMTGCLGLYAVLNLMGQDAWIELHKVFSILGYGILPIVLLAVTSVFFDLRGAFGFVLAVLVLAWCTHTSSRFFETALRMQHRRWLLAYPCFLLYTCFALMTIF